MAKSAKKSLKKKISSKLKRSHKQYKGTKLTKSLQTAKPRKKQKVGKKTLLAAGLPVPAATKIGTPKFTELQKKWYSKLAQNGFKDIEWVDHKTGKGQDSDYLKGSLAKGKPWNPDRAQFFRLLQNYLTHYQFKSRKVDRFIMTRLNDGWTYRKIHAECRKKYKFKKSLYWLYYHIQKLSQAMLIWNKTHEHGLLHPSNARNMLNDDLQFAGQDLIAPNGLKLDAGWWQENMSEWFNTSKH